MPRQNGVLNDLCEVPAYLGEHVPQAAGLVVRPHPGPRLRAGPSPSQCSHVLLLSPQRCVPQDTSYSSLFLKVLMQTLQWLDSPSVDGGPLQAQLKLFAAQYSARRRISDGEGGRARGNLHCWLGSQAVCPPVGGVMALLAQRGLAPRALGRFPREESAYGN